MKATMMLCDYAAVADGKLYISGGGWTDTGPAPAQGSIAVLLAIPWDRANHEIQFKAQLMDGDGNPVMQSDFAGQNVPVEISVGLEVGRPAGLIKGRTLDAPFVLTIPPVPLPPGSRFVWAFEIDGERKEDWDLPFNTRSYFPGTEPPVQ